MKRLGALGRGELGGLGACAQSERERERESGKRSEQKGGSERVAGTRNGIDRRCPHAQEREAAWRGVSARTRGRGKQWGAWPAAA